VSVLGFSHLELWVRDAGATAALFHERFGFSIDGCAEQLGPDGRPVAYELRQGDIVVFVTAASAGSEIADYVGRHGDGVRDIGFLDDDPEATFRRALAAGAEPIGTSGEGSRARAVKGFGDTVHGLVERGSAPTPAVTADMRPAGEPPDDDGPEVHLRSIDHCAVSVEAGTREEWARFYGEALGLAHVPGERKVEVEGSAFTMSTVQVPGGDAALVLAEPSNSARKSQIADYLEHFQGAGVHHIALATSDIARTVAALNARGVEMLEAPATYVETSDARLDGLDLGADWRELARLGVLVDLDEDGYLLQAFTPPIGDRPTTCLEIIQREGTRGFGAHNVRDLYSQVVREQRRREVSQA